MVVADWEGDSHLKKMFKFLKDTASAVNTQTITVGNYRVQIVRQIAEGGFAFVYMVKDAKVIILQWN